MLQIPIAVLLRESQSQSQVYSELIINAHVRKSDNELHDTSPQVHFNLRYVLLNLHATSDRFSYFFASSC